MPIAPLHFAAGIIVFLAGGCGRAYAAEPAPTPALVERIFAEVESVRGLKRKAPVAVEFLSPAAFLAALHAHSESLDPAKAAVLRASWIAFGLAGPGVDPVKLLGQAFDESIVGFYDPKTKRLCVRKAPPGAGSADDLRGVIAHELQHALQDQHFPGVFGDDKRSEDEELALRALVEGDAEATRLAVEARRLGRPVGYTLGATAAAIRSLGLEELIKRTGHSRALLEMPPVVRESLLFPYVSGLALAADLYRRGGFKLIDQAYAHPPVSTHQVLHTASYFAGERPVQLLAPAAPAGTRVLETTTLGELGARVVLETCVAPHVVRAYSDGWTGDSYTLFESPEHALGVVWRSVWGPGEGDAIVKLLRSQTSCWKEAARGKSSDGFTIDETFRARSVRERVALVRGVAKDKAEAAFTAALDFRPPAPGAPEPPLGVLAPPRADLKPRLDGDKFTSPRLGLAADIPTGLEADLEKPPAELTLANAERTAFAALLLVPEKYSERTARAFLESQQLLLTGGRKLPLQSEKPLKLLGHTGLQRTWGTGERQLRLAAVPTCGGAAYLALVAMHGSAGARIKVQEFVASLRSDGTAGVCGDQER